MTDTIVAISSSSGAAAHIIVRLTGGPAHELIGGIGCDERRRGVFRVNLHLAGMLVPCWIYSFLSPHSYTGEDLVELHVPGNPLLARMLVAALVKLGARPAEAGEFTARAFFNGRIDLAEAEGVAAAIGAHGEQELAAARQLMAGELTRRLRPIMDQLVETLALVETGIDFSEEQITLLDSAQLIARTQSIQQSLQQFVDESSRFDRLSHEPQIVLAGRPNSGKSTLLNALCGNERAVVSPVPGTTRDVIWGEAAVARGIVRIVDAAGLVEQSPSASDSSAHAQIARQMYARALSAIETADVLVLVREATDARPPIALPRKPDLTVVSKLDLLDTPVQCAGSQIAVSAKSRANLPELRRRLSDLAFDTAAPAATLALNARHLREIDQARAAIDRAASLSAGGQSELIALELREAADALGRITGTVTPDEVLGRIFASFCIGK